MTATKFDNNEVVVVILESYVKEETEQDKFL